MLPDQRFNDVKCYEYKGKKWQGIAPGGDTAQNTQCGLEKCVECPDQSKTDLPSGTITIARLDTAVSPARRTYSDWDFDCTVALKLIQPEDTVNVTYDEDYPYWPNLLQLIAYIFEFTWIGMVFYPFIAGASSLWFLLDWLDKMDD
jgi:hypothetical protein